MTPFGGVENWQLLDGMAILALLVSVAGTWITSSAVLRVYRSRVRRAMAEGSAEPHHFWAPPVEATSAVVTIVQAPGEHQSSLAVAARHKSRHAQRALLLGAVVYGLSGVILTDALDGLEILPVRTVVMVLLNAWVVVPSFVGQMWDRRPHRILAVWSAYFLLLIGAATIGGLSIWEVFALIAIELTLPGIFLVATSARPVRGVSWLVAPALLLLALAVWQLQWPARYMWAGVSFDRFAYIYLAGGLICLSAIGPYCLGLLWAYRRKLLNDQSLLILQWWFVLTFWHVVDLTSVHAWYGLLAFLPLILMSILIIFLWRLTGGQVAPPRRLVLLRTFGSRRRSTQLLQDLTRRWRWIGSVDLVSAPDIASEVLDPDEFVDFLRGRLSLRFIDGPVALERRVNQVDLLPDADGRFRVNEFLCRVDDWKPLVEVLVTSADTVVIDLRGFSPTHLGVVHEVERLVNLIDLRHVIAVVDESTDFHSLQWILNRAAAYSVHAAPIRRGGSAEFAVIPVHDRRGQDPGPLLEALFNSATAQRPAQ